MPGYLLYVSSPECRTNQSIKHKVGIIGVTLTNQNDIHDEITSVPKNGNNSIPFTEFYLP
jgi:hypothetical protein